MKVIHKHNIYLDKRQSNIYIDVMQADAYTRVLEFSLYSGGQAWNVPEGVDVAVAYIGSSGKGIYDTLPDGAAACDVNGNVVTAVVAPQAVAMDGNTNLNIIFTDDAGHQLAAFCVTLKVERNPAVNATKPPDYINLRQWMTAELANLVWDYAINVYPDQAGDGYVSERPYDAILREYESGRAVYCALEISDQERLQLPFVKIDGGVLYFSAVCAGKEYLVTINADGVTVEISECGGGNSGGNADQSGLTQAQIAALDGMFRVCAFIKEDVRAEYYAFLDAFGIGGEVEPDEPVIPDNPEKTLTSISAVYSGGSVTAGTAVTALTGIVVTAHYSDGSAKAVTGYTLSGTIAEGENTITVAYDGKTTTITVTGVAESGGGSEAVNLYVGELLKNNNISGITQNGNVISYTVDANGGAATFTIENLEADKEYTIFVESTRADTSGKYTQVTVNTDSNAPYDGKLVTLYPSWSAAGKNYATFTANGNTMYLWCNEIGDSVVGTTPTLTIYIYEGTLTEKP